MDFENLNLLISPAALVALTCPHEPKKVAVCPVSPAPGNGCR